MSSINFEDAVVEQARRLGMDPERDEEYLWLAEESLRAPLPKGWEIANDESRGLPYFFNESTGVTQWDHPMDEKYRDDFQRLKAFSERNDEPRQSRRVVVSRPRAPRDYDDLDDDDRHTGRRSAAEKSRSRHNQCRNQV